MRFKRVYHPFYMWEEIAHGMWERTGDKSSQLSTAINFTGNHLLYGKFMQRVINEWPISCENALTDYTLNRRAWLGHAACALAHRLPEHIVREAWGRLSDEQRLLANNEAGRFIAEWEHTYAARKGLHQNMENSLL